jgi:hypothetical protein
MIRDIEATRHIDLALAHLRYANSLYNAAWAGPVDDWVVGKRITGNSAVNAAESFRHEVTLELDNTHG